MLHWTQETLQILLPELLKPHFELEHRTVLISMRRRDPRIVCGAYRRLFESGTEAADTMLQTAGKAQRRPSAKLRELLEAGLTISDRGTKIFVPTRSFKKTFLSFGDVVLLSGHSKNFTIRSLILFG